MSHASSNDVDEADIEDLSRSLNESTFEWVNRPSTHTDDELASVSSLNISTADEAFSITGSEDADEIQGLQVSRGLYDQDMISPSHPLVDHSLGNSVEDSKLTEKEPGQPLYSPIRFNETIQKCTVCEVTHILNQLEHNENEVEEQFGHSVPQHRIILRQTMSTKSLELDRPFRVLYVGDEAPKNDIIKKIAQAIAVDCLSSGDCGSKLSIVSIPSSSDSDPFPNVALVSSTGLELIVDGFDEAQYFRLCESGYVEQKELFERTDLVILFHSPHTGMLMQQLRQDDMFAMMRQLGLPTIEISEDLHSENVRDFKPYRGFAIHMCLEPQDTDALENEVRVTLPIELSLFLGLDAGQLNRNMAFITSQRQKSPGLTDRIDTKDVVMNLAKAWDWLKAIFIRSVIKIPANSWHRSYLHQLQNSKFMMLAILLPFLLSFFISIISQDSKAVPTSSSAIVPNQVNIIKVPGLVPWTSVLSYKPLRNVNAITTPLTPSIDTGSNTEQTTNKYRSNIDPNAKPTNLARFPTNDAKNFQLFTSKDDEVYLLMPSTIMKLWHAPQIFIDATHDGKPIPILLKKLDPRSIKHGIVGVVIPDGKYHGCLEIKVWTEKKPIMLQNFQLCKNPSRSSRESIKEIAVRISHEGMRLSNIATKVSLEGKRLCEVATKAIAESSLSLEALVNQSINWQRHSAEKFRTSKSHFNDMTTALGEHFASHQVWLKAGFGKQHARISKKLDHLQKKASKDVKKMSKELSLWRDGATYGLSRRIQRARVMVKNERPKLLKRFSLGHMTENPFSKARSRAQKLWRNLPMRKPDFQYKRAARRDRENKQWADVCRP